MFSGRVTRRIGVGAGVLGLALIVFGSVWITAVFSNFKKIPSDWDQVDDLAGTYTDVDMAFLGRLQGNATIGQLLAAPAGESPLDDPAFASIVADQAFLGRLQGNATLTQLLAAPAGESPLDDPAVLSILGNPAVGDLVSDPGLLAVVQDPQSMQALADPTLLDLLSNPEVMGLLQDPSFLAALGDPIAMAQLASHPVAGPLLADPDVLALLQDPAFQTLLQGGALVALASQPQLLGLLSDPSLGLVLANPAVQVLLADPEALSLVLDERTQLLLANPAVQELIADSEALSLVLDPRTQRLMANPADLPTIDGQVVIHRVRRATGTDGNRIFINEQKTYIDPTTGQELPGFPMEDNDLVVDRKSKEYLPGTAEGRTGFWGLPFDVDKNRPYNSWVTAAKQPQPAVYQGTEKLEGLETYLFVQDVNDLDLGLDPILGLPLVVDASIKAWVEPKTGAIVRIDDRDVVSALDSSRSKHTLVMFDVKHTEETVALLVDDAKDNRNKIVWFGSVMPWMSMGLGMFLVVAAGSLIGLTTRRKGLLDSAS